MHKAFSGAGGGGRMEWGGVFRQSSESESVAEAETGRGRRGRS